MIHLFILSITDEKDRTGLDQQLNGPINAAARRSRQIEGPAAPAWWHGDEEASRSSMAAAIALKRRR